MHTNFRVRIRNIILGIMLLASTMLSQPEGIDSSVARAQKLIAPQPGVDTTVNFSNASIITKHIIHDPITPPACVGTEQQVTALPKSHSASAIVRDSQYDFGCSPGAARILFSGSENGGYDVSSFSQTISGLAASPVWVNMNVYPNLYAGPTNGGVLPLTNSAWPTWTDTCGDTYSNNPVIASHMGVDGRPTRGTIDDYWVCYNSSAPDPYITGGWAQHAWGDAVGDYMYTSQSAFGNRDGETQFYTYQNSASPYTCDVMSSNSRPDGTLGIKQFYQARGYAVGECYNQPTNNVIAGGFSFAQFKAQIDAGWPVLLGVEGHSILGIGYDISSNLVYLYNGWDNDIHTMEWKEDCYNPAKSCSVSYKYQDPANNFDLPLQFVSIVKIVPGSPKYYTISGNTGVADATITYTGGSTLTDSSGNYSFTVSESWFGTVTPSKTGHTFRPTSRSYANVVANQTGQDYNELNLLLDPSFEAYTPNPYWTEASTNFQTPLCKQADCLQPGATFPGPRTGLAWGWFGGTPNNETASVSQTLTIPSGSATLSFYFWISAAGPGSDTSDVFTVKIDNTTVFSANATQIGLYPAYTPISVDISAFANNASHKITFSSVTTGQQVDFNLDDVSLTGTTTIAGNAGIAEATLSYTDSAPKTVTADGGGNYLITVPFYWSGTVTPSKAGYAFSPTNRTYTNLTSKKTAQNYTTSPITYTISGNAGIAGATLTYTDGTTKVVTADANGNYSFLVSYSWSGTVKPSKTGYRFFPVVRSYLNVLENQTGQNYTAREGTGGADTTGVFRPSNGALYLKNQNTTGFADVQINYGQGGDYPIVGDWDGNGTVTIGIYRGGSFYLRNANTIGFADVVFPFGAAGDQPVAGDWDGDGITTIGVYRNGTFFLRNSNSAGAPSATFALGVAGDVGIAGDWNGDGMDTTGVFRPSNGALYLKNQNTTGFADIQINYGLPGDRPVTGDWNDDGVDTIGVYRNGQFMLRNSNTIGFAEIVFALGVPGDMPIAGNWDGIP